MHPSSVVAPDLVAGPAWGTPPVGELAVEPGGGLGGLWCTSQGAGWKTRSARWEKAQPGRQGWPQAGRGLCRHPPGATGRQEGCLAGTDAAGRLERAPGCSHGTVSVTRATSSHISCSRCPLAGEAAARPGGCPRKGDHQRSAAIPRRHHRPGASPRPNQPGIVPSPWRNVSASALGRTGAEGGMAGRAKGQGNLC